MHAGCPQRWSPIEVGVESTSSLARCNYMSVTRILNENRCVVRWTNDLNFRVTCGKCLKLSRGHGLVPSADSRLPDLNGGAMPGLEIFFLCALHAQWQGVALSMATHEIRKALLQISRFIYQQFVSKCAAAQIKVPAAAGTVLGSIQSVRSRPDFLMPCTWRTRTRTNRRRN